MAQNLMNGDMNTGTTGVQVELAGRADRAESLRGLHARNPQESLGLPEQSALPRACLQAGLIIVGLMAVLTAGDYLLKKQFPAESKAAPKPAEAAATDTAPPAPNPANLPASSPSANKPADVPADTAKSPQPKKKDILDHLGESGSKKAGSGNPLDKKEDDLLKDLK